MRTYIRPGLTRYVFKLLNYNTINCNVGYKIRSDYIPMEL
jgi:hypothetical protein